MVALCEMQYAPAGAHRDLWHCRHRAVLFEGPAGTGKTRADLEKAHVVAESCPDSRQLFIRRTLRSLRATVLDLFESEVLPPNHPAGMGPNRRMRDEYHYPNGSVIRLGGVDTKEDADKVMSGFYDRIYIFEALDLRDPDPVQKLMTRLRNGRTSYHQIILECNPGAPSHWLNQWAISGRLHRIRTTHRDNPRYWSDGDWTREGREYVLGALGALEGTLRARLLDGQWVQADGLVYDTFRHDLHLRDGQSDSTPRRVVIGVDDGYTDPFAALRCEIDEDGRLFVAASVYASGMSVRDKIEAVRDLGGDEATVIYDAAAAVIGNELRQNFPDVQACDKTIPVAEGCHLVRERMRDPGDGRPRLALSRDCDDLIRELEAYEWKKRRDGSGKDEPIDQHNHALDALRYVVVHLDGNRVPPIVASGYRVSVWDDEAMWN